MVWQEIADLLVRKASVMRAKVLGFEFGVVVDTEDPWQLGRVRVKFPWHGENDMSDWAWPANGIASDGAGSTFHIPQVDDLVLCVFYGGDITRPAYLGGVWTPGGIGPRGQIKQRKSLVQGYQPQDPSGYDPTKSPNSSPQPYPEPATGAWITNDPTTRVHEFKTKGGLRLLWEEFKRRLRLWTHPSTAFTVEVDHFDGESIEPPRATPYHNMQVSSPKGTTVQIEEDEANGNYITKVQHHTGHKIVLHELNNGVTSQVVIQNAGGEKITWDHVNQQLIIEDRGGGKIIFDALAKTRKLQDPAGSFVLLNEIDGSITIQAAGNLSILAGGTVTIDGSTINIG